MKPAKTRRDRFGRTLAQSRRGRGREIVIATPAEQLEPERMAALGVAMVSDDQPTEDTTTTAAATAPAGGGEGGEASYPIHQGGGWYLLSNGDTVRGGDDAVAAEARLQGEAEEEG